MANKKKRAIQEVSLPVVFIKEGKKYSAYTPALDLATCGDSFEHAQKMFVEAVTLFLEECVEMGTLDDVLRDCGWQEISRPGHRRELVPPEIIASTSQQVRVPLPT